MATKFMYKKNTQTVTVTVTDSSRALITGATVTGNLVDGNAAPVAHATNFSMTEVDSVASPGVYSAVIPKEFDPPPASNYILQITADKLDGSQYYGESPITVQIRAVS